jgi:colanic acid biosynthesis glycosyl transferase WcaI
LEKILNYFIEYKLKILIMSQWFDPEPTFKGLFFAEELVKQGHQVEVITGFPNYPGGKIYDGYKIRPYQREVINDVVIHRVPLYPSHDGSAIKRVLNYISFAIASFIYGLFFIKKVDVIYSYHPPLTTALSSTLISFFRRIPMVVDIQDLWPDTLEATGMLQNKSILNLVDKLCNFVYRQASKVVVLSPGFKNKLSDRGVSEEKLEIIYNWCDESALIDGVESKVLLPDNGNFNVVFAGNLGHAQGLPSIVKAAKILEEREIHVNIVFLGDGIAKKHAIKISDEFNLNNTFFIPRVPLNEVGSILAKADALLVHLTGNELFSITIPSRTQAYLAMGKPIIMAVEGDASNLIKSANAGLCCEPDKPNNLADAVIEMFSLSSIERENLGNNASVFYQSNLSLKVGVNNFMRVFNEIIK